MASLLDAVGLLETLGFYTVIFPFLLIFGIVYGVLLQTKVFGDSKSVNGIVAATVALIAVSVMKLTIFITAFLQLVIAFLLIVFLMMIIFIFMGVKVDTIAAAMVHPVGYSSIIILFFVFFFIAMSVAFPELSQVAAGGEVEGEAFGIATASKIIGNPTVLGLIVMFIIFTAAAAFITYTKG
jgi:hypothetical protein